MPNTRDALGADRAGFGPLFELIVDEAVHPLEQPRGYYGVREDEDLQPIDDAPDVRLLGGLQRQGERFPFLEALDCLREANETHLSAGVDAVRKCND